MPSSSGSVPADPSADRHAFAPGMARRPSWTQLLSGLVAGAALTGLVLAGSHLATLWTLEPAAAAGLALVCALLCALLLPTLAQRPAERAPARPAALPELLDTLPEPTVLLQRHGDRWQVMQLNSAAHRLGLPAGGVAASEWLATADPATASQAAEPSETESFAYTVSHDLRAPIRVIEGFTRIVREDYGHVLDRIGNDHLDRVLGAAARMNSMIDALLTLARLSSQPLARQRVDLSRTAQYVLDDLQKHAPQRRVETRVMAGLQVDGDPTLLRLVLENLLGNAFKYSSRRDVAHIEFGCEWRPKAGAAHPPPPEGSASTWGGPASTHADGQQVYYVSDDGAGFDMRFADRLFGAFQRLHSASEFQGTGVGLASVRRIVRRHGGEIWAQAEVDRGATFYFTLG